jgi:hypothetical protein
MQRATRFLACLVAMLASLHAVAAETSPDAVQEPRMVRRGIIDSVDLAGPSYVIDALRYGIATDAVVQVGGSFGAPTMLRPGMRVEFLFQGAGAEDRVIVAIRELDRVEAAPRH